MDGSGMLPEEAMKLDKGVFQVAFYGGKYRESTPVPSPRRKSLGFAVDRLAVQAGLRSPPLPTKLTAVSAKLTVNR